MSSLSKAKQVCSLNPPHYPWGGLSDPSWPNTQKTPIWKTAAHVPLLLHMLPVGLPLFGAVTTPLRLSECPIRNVSLESPLPGTYT